MNFQTHLELITFDYGHMTLCMRRHDHSDDGVEDRYSVLVEFEDQKSADGFYLDLNGWRFSSSEVVRLLTWSWLVY